MRDGDFVVSLDNALGRAKYVERSGDVATVEYFDPTADGNGVFHYVDVPFDSLRRSRIPKHSPVWLKQHGAWRCVRVSVEPSTPGEPYGIALSGDQQVMVPEAGLYVRWKKPIGDPVNLLSNRCFGTARAHVARHRFLATVMKQRAACQEMTGILSSVVDLHEHQVDVARRVLSDPIQRYILADEVGLGKTIEAGFVLRQVLIDNPAARIVVLVPGSIGRQWERELREKFLVDALPDAKAAIHQHHQPERWPTGEHLDLLVVDEAHHLARMPEGDKPTDRYEQLRQLAANAERLLLLSATPVRSNERNFLAMLHLLDPEAYRLDDVEGFRRRVENRDRLAIASSTLRPDMPAFLIAGRIRELRELCPGDDRLSELLDALAEAGKADEADLAAAISAVRTHLSERYRLHRRLLRNRREGHVLAEFPVRHRTRDSDSWMIEAVDDRDAESADWFDEFRLRLLDLAEDHPERAADALRLVGERVAAHPMALRPVIDGWSGTTLSGHPDEAAPFEWLADVLPDDPLVEQLKRVVDREVDNDRLNAVVDHLHHATGGRLEGGQKIVAFTSFGDVADVLAERYEAKWGKQRVARHLAEMDVDEQQAELDRFASDPICGLLVCDASAEEGRNLQFADVVAHVDVPWSANRLEQRIGRLDRFGVGLSAIPAESVVIVGSGTDSISRQWAEYVDEAFGVFATSSASLQYVIEDLEQDLMGALLRDGIPSLHASVEASRERVTVERAAIEAQDALDSLEDTDERRELFETLVRTDQKWQKSQDVCNAWVKHHLGFWQHHDDEDSRRFKYTVNTRKPPRISAEDLPGLRPDLLDAWVSHSRKAALANRGDRLLVAGDPFLDAVVDYTESDDRALASAVFRQVETPLATPELALRFDFHVTADPSVLALSAGSPETDRALRRLADGFLAPRSYTVWIDESGQESPASLDAVLNRRFGEDAGDRDLSSEHRPWLNGLLDRLDWGTFCREARDTAQQRLRTREELEAYTAAGLVAAQRWILVETDRVAARKDDANDGVLVDSSLPDRLLAAIKEPSVQLVSCGLVVLGNTPP